jgi:hypothetical protein
MQHRQRGLALIEILGALLISAMLMAGVTSMIDTSLQDVKAQQAAQYQAQVTAAATRYLANPVKFNSLTAGALNQTVAIPMTQLKDYQPPQAGANPYGQTGCLLVRPRPSAADPSVIVLDALVVTEGGQAIPDGILPFAAANAGVGGGYISVANPALAQSSSGSWSLGPATAPTLANFVTGGVNKGQCSARAAGAGSLASALFFGGPGQNQDFLYRNQVPGMPGLNTMNTPIGMGLGATVVAGAACSGAAIGVDASRNLMTCSVGNTWTALSSTWKAPVATFASLTTIASTPPTTDQAGDVRMTRDTNRAFVLNASRTAWVALAVDQNGNMAVSNNLTVGGNANVAKDLHVTQDVNVDGNINALDGTVTGQYILGTDWVAAPTVQAWEGARVGDGCHRWVGTDPKGAPIYWHALGTIVRENGNSAGPRASSALICAEVGAGNFIMVHMDGTYW